MKKFQMARCPYCGKRINFFFLCDCKKKDVGCCSNCGGFYAVKYSNKAWLGFLLLALVLAGGIVFQYLANKTMPSAACLLLCAAAFVVYYFLLPLFITPRRCVINGKLGGFPNRWAMPLKADGAFAEENDDQDEEDEQSERPREDAPVENIGENVENGARTPAAAQENGKAPALSAKQRFEKAQRRREEKEKHG